MSLYAAIDLHSTNSVLAVLDESDRPLRQRRLPNELPVILKELEPFHDEITGIVVESTYNWYWLVDGLMDHGYTVHLANTAAVPQYAGLKHGDDESDARHLAQLLRLGILPEGYIYPREERAVRDLLRRRFQLVRMAVGLMLSMQSTWARHTGQRISGNGIRQLAGPMIERAFPDPSVRMALLTHLQVRQGIEVHVRQIERWIIDAHIARAAMGTLRTVPGIGARFGPRFARHLGPKPRPADFPVLRKLTLTSVFVSVFVGPRFLLKCVEANRTELDGIGYLQPVPDPGTPWHWQVSPTCISHLESTRHHCLP